MHPPFFKGAGKDRDTTALPDARHLASLLYNCLKYDRADLSRSLIMMIVTQSPEMDLSDMREYWVPGFLLPLIHLLPDCELELPRPLDTSEGRFFTQTLVHLLTNKYLSLLVGKTPVVSEQDYWRQPVHCADNYKLCDELNSFLESQQQARGFLYYVGTEYDHMASQIEGREDCKSVAEPVPREPDDYCGGRRQCIIIVTKTAQTFAQRVVGWEARLATAWEFVTKLKEEPLQTRLKVHFGGQTNGVINIDLRNFFKMGMERWQPLGDPILPLDHPLFPKRESDFPPSLAGTKRKAEDQGQR